MVRLLRTGEAAAIVGVAPQTLKNWADAGVIQSTAPPGVHRQFDEAALLEWRRTREADQNVRAAAWTRSAAVLLAAAVDDVGATSPTAGRFRDALHMLTGGASTRADP